MALIILLSCIALLIVLITRFKVNAFLAFLIVSVVAALALGMPLGQITASVNKGIGDTLGSIVLIIVLGAMLGKLVGASGAAQRIVMLMKDLFGAKYITWAMALTGFIVGIPLFYNVGFVLLVPIIYAVSKSFKLPLVYVGLPMLTSLSVMHGYMPPHPSPVALIAIFHADMAKTFVFGLLIAIPAIIIAGPLFAYRLRNMQSKPTQITMAAEIPLHQLPGAFNSIFSALLPAILIALSYLLANLAGKNTALLSTIHFLGDPVMVMLFTVIIATITLGLGTGKTMKQVMDFYADAVKDIAMILLIIGSAGILKQIFIDSKLNIEIADMIIRCPLPPLLLAWLVTASLRLCLGSATVAGITAAGVLFPAMSHLAVNPNLLVLVVGAGSLFGSHVNDTAFWLFKEYFGLSMKQTFLSWTMMESMVSVIGLIGAIVIGQILLV